MIQFLNDIWIAFCSENVALVNLLLIPATILENYLFMKLFLNIFNVKATIYQKITFIILFSTASILSSHLLIAPFNVFVNYIIVIVVIKLIFKLSTLKSFMSLIIPTFILGMLNVLMQKPFIIIFNISLDTLLTIPIYRFSFLAFIYFCMIIICIVLKNFKTIKFSLDFLDMLDNKTFSILIVNLIVGFLTLCIQLVVNTFYIDIVPILITILSFILLIAFLLLSIYSFTRMIKLATTKMDLQTAEEYNKSLEILYDKVKGFNHDFNNIVSTINGFIENNDMAKLKDYFEDIKKDCKITNNLSVLNPRVINNPGIYSLLNNKYFKATNCGVTFDIDFFLDLNKLNISTYKFSRILGILIDNAIEEAEKCEEKVIKLTFKHEGRNNRAIILIENTYSNKDVDIDAIFKKGISGKENHSGIGLWEVRNYVSKTKNLDLFTRKTDKFFIQELSIYDLKRVSYN